MLVIHHPDRTAGSADRAVQDLATQHGLPYPTNTVTTTDQRDGRRAPRQCVGSCRCTIRIAATALSARSDGIISTAPRSAAACALNTADADVRGVPTTKGNEVALAGDEEWTCAFCGDSTVDDPRWVQMRLTWAHTDAGQILGAHHACLVAALEPGFPMAVEGPYE